MKIKRFHAKNMRNTIRKVREELGADAVILSNRQVADGVEIIAAIDYDESLLPASAVTSATDEQDKQYAQEKSDYIEVVSPKTEIAVDINESLVDDQISLQTSTAIATAKNAAIDGLAAPGFATSDFNIPAFSESKVETDALSNKLAEKADAIKPGPAHIWSEEPVIVAMQDELKSLRGLLVNQLSGLAWGQESRYHPLRARLLQRLLALGLSPTLAREISGESNEQESFDKNWRLALGQLAHRIPIAEHDIVENGGVVALVGATGVGKTTTIAKLAARYTLRHGPQNVLLVTTDNQRVAAHEQLRSYARILGVPMRVATNEEDLRGVLHGFSDKGLILIDTAGMNQTDMHLTEQLGLLNTEAKNGQREIQIYLTLAANSQRRVLEQVAQAFKDIPLAGSILTKLDETASLGGALSVAVEQNLAVSYFCDGQQVPEDIHLARQHTLVSRSVAIIQQLASTNHDEGVSIAVGGMVANANH